MKSHIKHFVTFAPSIALVVLLVVSVFSLAKFSPKPEIQSTISQGTEIDEIKVSGDLSAQIKLYKRLIDRVGPVQAQEDLLHSGLPFTGQTHLLNHTVGEYLYEKYGSAGLQYCKEYFLSSCYHGFISNAIAAGGMQEVEKTFTGCLKSGPAISSQCAHAIGHGFLANVGYKNLPDALKSCDIVLKDIPTFPTFNCYDGVFMENIWGVHDGAPSPDRWINPKDIKYPCDDKRIDNKYILACWSNQPSLVYQLLGGDIKKVASNLCNKVEDFNYKQMCFDGLSRQIHPITRGSPEKTFQLCGLMPDSKWVNFCIDAIAGASYAVGDKVNPFNICSNTAEDNKRGCFLRLFSNMKTYAQPGENYKLLCSKISDKDWQTKCRSW